MNITVLITDPVAARAALTASVMAAHEDGRHDLATALNTIDAAAFTNGETGTNPSQWTEAFGAVELAAAVEAAIDQYNEAKQQVPMTVTEMYPDAIRLPESVRGDDGGPIGSFYITDVKPPTLREALVALGIDPETEWLECSAFPVENWDRFCRVSVRPQPATLGVADGTIPVLQIQWMEASELTRGTRYQREVEANAHLILDDRKGRDWDRSVGARLAVITEAQDSPRQHPRPHPSYVLIQGA